MQMLEIITVRIAEDDWHDIESMIKKLAIDIKRESQGVKMTLYAHSTLNTDICIQLKSTLDLRTSNKTHLGLILATSLRSFGLVDHTCWIEQNMGCRQDQSGKTDNSTTTENKK